MERPIDILADAVKAHGFEVESVAPPFIKGKWHGEEATVFVFSSEEEKEALYLFLDWPLKFRAIASFLPLDEGVLMALEREGVVLWDRPRAEALVGRHYLLARAGLRLEEPLFPAETPRPQEIFLAPLEIQGEQTLIPKVSRAEAEHRAARVGGFDFKQVLVPHYLFRYRCIIQTSGSEERQKQGLVWVDAVNGNPREFNTQFSAVDELDIPHFKMEPELEMSDAVDMAIEGIVVLNTRESEEVRHTGTATIFEKQKTFPVQESIETEFVGLLYVPMWNIEGSRGTMTINAVTGEVVSEQSYQMKD